MDKVTIFSNLYEQAIAYGWEDSFRKSAPIFASDREYIEWLVAFGSFKVLAFSDSFMDAIAKYFVAKNVSDPTALDAKLLLGATIAATDPLNYLGAFLKEAMTSDTDFVRILADTTGELAKTLGTENLTLSLSDDKKTASIELGSYKNSITIKGDTEFELYTALTSGLRDLSEQAVHAMIQKGVQAFSG